LVVSSPGLYVLKSATALGEGPAIQNDFLNERTGNVKENKEARQAVTICQLPARALLWT